MNPRLRSNIAGIATDYGLDDEEVRVLSPGWFKKFNVSMSSRSVVGSTQPTIRWVEGALFPVGGELKAGAWNWPLTSN
jgi:hypothetical protein